MGDEDDVQAALAFLRKHDVSHTGAPTRQAAPVLLDANVDIDDGFEDLNVKSGFEPNGPNWKKPGNFAQLPKIANHPDGAWLMHERQDQSGRYKPWLFFSKMTGEYYRVNDSGNGYEPISAPHNPWSAPFIVRAGNASILSEASQKLDMTVLLPDLQKTGFLLKQPLDFLDKPASLFVLCAGLRNSVSAAEFCAKRFHGALLPKLSSRPTVWYDHELIDLVKDATETLDKQLLESPACFAGCSFAVALLAGCRLVVASLGSARCLLCRPTLTAADSRKVANVAGCAPVQWTANPVAGSGSHSLTNKDETSRIEGELGFYKDGHTEGSETYQLFGRSSSSDALAAIGDEWEREFQRVTRAMNSFAVLGMTAQDIKEGATSARKIFRRRSLIVHPDKVEEERRQRTTAVFAKLEAAVDTLENAIQLDSTAAGLLANIHCIHDEGRLGADPSVAAKLLGVAEGCTKAEAGKAAQKRFHEPLSKLQEVARQDVERALKILEIAEECACRSAKLWTPPEKDLGIRVSRALGCKDLKQPVKLLSNQLSVELIQLEVSEVSSLVLITEGAEGLTDTMVARRLAEHAPTRPRAAALRIAIDGAKLAQKKANKRNAISAVCAYFRGEQPSSNDTFGLNAPPAKRMRSGLPDCVRMCHVMLRWAGLKGDDEFQRPGVPVPTRTQAEAEKELLELAEVLLAARDPKTLGARFKAAVLKHSECSSALKVPHADLGWLEPGGAEPAFEVAAFDTALGGLSDVVVTSRGAHLMYRLG